MTGKIPYIVDHPQLKNPLWIGSEHFEAKMMDAGYLRISIKESRYLFCYPEDLDELIQLMQEAKRRMGE